MEFFFIIAGLWMIYTTAHFMVISLKRMWDKSTTYEKVVMVSAVVSVSLVYLGIMFE